MKKNHIIYLTIFCSINFFATTADTLVNEEDYACSMRSESGNPDSLPDQEIFANNDCPTRLKQGNGMKHSWPHAPSKN